MAGTRGRALAVMLTVASLLSAGCAGGAVTATASGQRSTDGSDGEISPVRLDWGDCPQRVSKLDQAGLVECATLEVPRDYERPDDGTVGLLLARAATAGRGRIGSLVMNPGGPGASGAETLAGLMEQLPDGLTDRFDLVSFDPRGVGGSEGVRCFDDAEQDRIFFDPTPGPTGEPALAEQRRENAACTERAGDLLPHLGTANAARDLDRIRAALGDDKLSYLGYSYGTLLGAVYAEQFPDRVRAMVLDGPVDPSQTGDELGPDQTKGFRDAFDRWAAACAAQPSCPLGPDPAARVNELRDRLAEGPIPAPRAPGGGRLTFNNASTALVQTFYAQEQWAPAAQGVRDALDGDGSVLVTMASSYVGRAADGTWDTIVASNRAIACADDPERPDPATAKAPTTDLMKDWPFGSPEDDAANDDLTCLEWPETRAALPDVSADRIPPTLIVATTGDPATPQSWADGLQAALPGSVVLRFDGEGHTVFPGETCVDSAVVAYLTELRAPADETTCSPDTGATGGGGEGEGPQFGDLGRELGTVVADLVEEDDSIEVPADFTTCFDSRLGGVSESDLALFFVLQDPERIDPRVLSSVQQATASCAIGG